MPYRDVSLAVLWLVRSVPFCRRLSTLSDVEVMGPAAQVAQVTNVRCASSFLYQRLSWCVSVSLSLSLYQRLLFLLTALFVCKHHSRSLFVINSSFCIKGSFVCERLSLFFVSTALLFQRLFLCVSVSLSLFLYQRLFL